FLRRWQGVGDASYPGRPGEPADEDASDIRLTRALQQLRGLPVPGTVWERDVLPARVTSFEPGDLAARCQGGDVMWVADGARDPRRARIAFFFRGEGGLFLDRRPAEATVAGLSEPARAVLEYLTDEGAALIADVVEGCDLDRATAQSAL